MSLDGDAAVAHALLLPDMGLTTYYGEPGVKPNIRPVVTHSREAGSFCLRIDKDKVEMMKAIDPDTSWQTEHYEDYPAILVRFAATDVHMMWDQIVASRDWAMTWPKPKLRKT